MSEDALLAVEAEGVLALFHDHAGVVGGLFVGADSEEEGFLLGGGELGCAGIERRENRCPTHAAFLASPGTGVQERSYPALVVG